ncbi:uncharacterized protein LTR77_006850 [Saxophila tyrrhenica]|uniref:RNA polymerase I-specific transcription initiation factor RRN6-like protein n=1 Tax=Saxophila tyrrhenica TaxID=1690608 RepID=A0AAV9PA16_9PEZI|nr:hypothetical protein LTR77_006850 [Saxophila tyrrhenica]
MGERDRDSAGYGSHERPLYRPDKSQWTFERSTASATSLYAVGSPRTVHHQEDSELPAHDEPSKAPPSARLVSQTKALLARAPELQAASDLLAPLARVSDVITQATDRHDPGRSNLLVSTTVSDKAVRKPARIVAYVSGSTGSDLRVSQIQLPRQGWGSVHRPCLRVPTVHGESTKWIGPGAPIQGLVSGHPDGRGNTYLAVRLPTKTVVLRPVMSHAPSYTESRLETHSVYEFTYPETGETPHADVAFDPWFTRRIAFVDRTNLWSVWQLPGEKGAGPKRVCQGSLHNDASHDNAQAVDDGWARIAWVFDTTLIAVCNRCQLKIFEVSEGFFFETFNYDVALESGSGWILDMAALEQTPRILCILTTEHLVVYSINRRPGSNLVVHRSIAIRHYRNPEDITLCLRLVETKQDTAVIIFSTATPTITVYTLDISDETFVTTDDAVELVLSRFLPENSASHRIVDLYLSEGFYDQLEGQSIDEHDAEMPRLYSIFSLDSASALHECMCATTPHLSPPTWRKALPKSVTRVANDDFMVDDDDVEIAAESAQLARPQSAYVQRRRAEALPTTGDEWTIGYKLSVRQLNDVDVSQVTNVDEVLEETRDALRNENSVHDTPLKTIRELTDGELTISNLGRSNQQLNSLKVIAVNGMRGDAEVDEPRRRPTLCPVAPPPALELPANAHSEPFSVYDQAAQKVFTSHLPDDLPELVRHTREHLAQRMGVELALASQVFRLESAEPVEEPEQEPQSQEWKLPLRSAPASYSQQPGPTIDAKFSSQLQGSSQSQVCPELQPPPLPTPSASTSAPQSSATGTSYSTAQTSQSLARLSRYTAFTNATTTPTLPRRLNRVLTHWNLGDNPSTYDWRTTSHTISQNENAGLSNEDMTERERQRVQRRAERNLRRQRREAEESQKQQALSSQAPYVVSASQPRAAAQAMSQGTQRVKVGSQSQGMSQEQMVASQVLPGRHGGRGPARKKRKSGF